MNRDASATSVGSAQKKVQDNFVAPQKLLQKTKEDQQYYKENPRPASAQKKKAQDSDDYSEDNYEDGDDFEEEDKEADMKLEKLRKAMAKENNRANKMADKGLIKDKDKNLHLKVGPSQRPAMDLESLKNQYVPQEVTKNIPQAPTDTKNLKQFTKQTMLVMNEVIDHEAANT